MAQIDRPKLTRNTVTRGRVVLPQASAAAQAAGRILTESFGEQEWIFQVMEAVKFAVQNGIEQLSKTNLTSNGHPGDGYRFEPRSRDELIASQQLAAEDRAVAPNLGFQELRDPAEALAEPSGKAKPPAARKKSEDGPQGWLM